MKAEGPDEDMVFQALADRIMRQTQQTQVSVKLKDLQCLRQTAIFGIHGPTHNMEWLQRIDTILKDQGVRP